MSDALVRSYRLVVRIVLLQAGCAVWSRLCFLCSRRTAGLAALVGGLIVAVGSALFGWRVFKPGIAGAAVLNTAMYAGVALKWLWFALALYIALARLNSCGTAIDWNSGDAIGILARTDSAQMTLGDLCVLE